MQVNEKSYNGCTYLHADLLPLQYSNFCLTREYASLYSGRFYFRMLMYMQKRFRHQNKPFYVGIGMKQIQ